MNMTVQHEPRVFIVSGPSASGKSTLVKKLLQLPKMLWSVSCTTRQPRPDDKQGIDWYTFVSQEEFERMVERDEFLEYAKVFGKYWYGTPRKWLDEARNKGWDLLLEIDVQGAVQVKGKIPDAISIFIIPPSKQELESRLRARGTNSEEEIARRLARARQEMESYQGYDYVVVNDDLERAGGEVQAIAMAARCSRVVNDKRIRQILDSFGG
jgi:guanylate kinase